MTAETLSLPADLRLVSAAKVAVLNLDAIKAMMGAKWDRVEPLVVAFFESAIKSSLQRGDAYFKFGELDYIILYRHCSPEEAQAKCAVLCRNVCERLFGTEGVEATIRNLVGQVDDRLIEAQPAMLQAINKSLEQYGHEVFISSGSTQGNFSRTAIRPPVDLKFGHHDSCDIVWESDLSFTYRVIWDCVSRAIHCHLCQPLPPKGIDTELLNNNGFCTAASGNETDCALLDRTVLAHCATRIDRLRGPEARLAVPIHFSTLSRARPWVYFQEVYRQIPPSILKELAFVVFGIGGAPNVRLVQEMPRLAAARQVFCVADPGPNASVQFAYAKVHAVGMELTHSQHGQKSLPDSIKSIARAARSNGYESFLLGVSTASQARIAVTAGVRYIEGAPIQALVADPRSVFGRELETLRANRPQ